MSDSVFVRDDLKPSTESIPEKEQRLDSVPNRYIPVQFCSLGKLSAPEKLHFRNYTLEEAAELSAMREENYLEKLITTLNNMVWEDFDCANLHEEELKEVMLNIRYNFWGKSLDNVPYYINENLESPEELNRKDNIGFAKLSLEEVAQKVRNLTEEFREPVKIQTPDGSVVRFRLPRVTDDILAKKYVDNLFKEEEKKFANIRLQLRTSDNIDLNSVENPEQFLEYLNLVEQKESMFFKARAVQRIVGFDDQPLSKIEAQLEASKDIDLTVWNDLYGVDQQIDFGVDAELSFYDEQTQETKIRRFQFRPLVFVPDMESRNDSRNVVSFGD